MRPLLKHAKKIAARDVPILLSGETGAGKTHLAQLVHESSARASRPFLAVNSGALPTALIEAELFGHVKGAFTGAEEERIGKFAHVQDGTLLLDEIDALPLSAQTKLLRVLDQGVFEPVGSNQSLPFRARLIAASNQRLEGLIEKDLFRADLYYRLNVVQLYVPALRDRRPEIRPLVDCFLETLATKHGVPVPAVDANVWDVLAQYDWPGNLRELRNAVEHALTFCEGGSIQVEDLPAKFGEFASPGMLGVTPREHERLPDSIAQQSPNFLALARKEGEYRHLLDVLDECHNNKTQAARVLGISRTALYKKLLAFGIS
jgi:DNA-binding NtrC family response regulator